MKGNSFLAILAGSALFYMGATTRSIGQYSFTAINDPSTLPGYGTVVFGISGTNIVGQYYSPSGTHAFLSNGNTYTTIDDPLGIDSSATGISGTIIVGTYLSNATVDEGFVYNGTTYTTIHDPLATGNTQVNGISGSEIVGTYANGSGTHGFIYNGTSYTTLPSVSGGGTTTPQSISGTNIVGTYVAPNGTSEGYLLSGNTFTFLNDPMAASLTGTGYGTDAYAIAGNLIGGTYYGADNQSHGFLYNGTSFITVDAPSTSHVGIQAVTGINNSNGNLVGSYHDATGYHDYLASPEGA